MGSEGFRSPSATCRSPNTAQRAAVLSLCRGKAGTMCPRFYSLGVVCNCSPILLLHSKLNSYELSARSFLG